MTDVHLDATDAMELAELLLFVRNWLARDNHVLAPPFQRRGQPQVLLAGLIEQPGQRRGGIEARRQAGRLRFSSLPEPWTLTDFDFAAQPSLADFIGVDGYHLPELREDLTRFAFLLGGDHEESFLSG